MTAEEYEHFMGEPKPEQKKVLGDKEGQSVIEHARPKGDLTMTMMPNENVLAQSGGLVLTTHRIRVETQTQIISIMLEELCSCETRFASHPFLLILAGLFALGGFLMSGIGAGENAVTSGSVIAVIFVAIYFATRKAVITLASAGAQINLQRKQTDLQEARQIIDQIEAAKNQRYLLAHAAAANYSGVAAT